MNKKGFTLTEALTIIVLIGVLGLIVTPLVMNYIKQSKKEALKTSAYGLIRAADNEYKNILMNGYIESYVVFTYDNGNEESSPIGLTLDYKGAKPQGGNIVINTEGEIALAITDGEYCVEKAFDESEVKESSKLPNQCFVEIEAEE